MSKDRVCRICKTIRSNEDFYKGEKTNRCKACETARKRKERKERSHVDIDRRKRLKKEYGISLETYEKMFLLQNGKCLICGNSETMNRKNLCIDHCHKTNKIRGLLCNACNAGLGQFYDNINSLKKAIKYLKKWQQ